MQCKLELKGYRKICNRCYFQNVENKMQFCAKCETLKLYTEFSINRTTCKICDAYKNALSERKIKRAVYRTENKVKRAAYMAVYDATPEQRSKRKARQRDMGNPDLITSQAEPYIRLDDCVICGGPGGTVDHLKCISKGGINHWLNMAPMCLLCNDQKGKKSLEEFLKWRRDMSG